MTAANTAMHESLNAFLRSLEGKNRSEATVKAYRTDLLQFFVWLQDNNIAATAPERIERADITEYLAHLSHWRVSGVSRARKLAAIREYFRYLEAHDIIVKSPAAGVDTPRREKNIRAYLAPDEYNRILSLAGSNPRDFAIFQVFLQTGVRVSELAALRVDDIDFASRVLRVRVGKGMAGREIELEPKVIKAIKNYLASRPNISDDRLFLNYAHEPISERGLRKLVVRYRVAAGITKSVSCHSLRHTFATEKAKRGVSPYQLQSWLGHASLNTTQVYVHLAKQNGHKVMEQTSL